MHDLLFYLLAGLVVCGYVLAGLYFLREITR